MAKYTLWHPNFAPEEFKYIENAFETALEWIREIKEQEKENRFFTATMNNCIIERTDLPRPVKVVLIRGKRLE